MADDGQDEPGGSRFGLKALILVVAFHAVAVSIATYPAVATFRSAIPCNADPWEHLWIMRWYKTCLAEGRSVVFCPEIQAPVGAPFGTFTPLHLQSAIYVPLSTIIHDDVILYNILWMFGLLLTGLGTTALAWHLLRSRPAAALAGMLAMLSGPMMIHACAQLELIYVGMFPIFLAAWMRFVDRPSAGRLAAAAAGYVLVSMSAAYYMVFAVFPAVLYVVWAATRGGKAEIIPWIKSRAGWFVAMAGLTLPILLGLFWSHVWAASHGYSLARSRVEFNMYGAPIWGYAVPSPRHLLGRLLPFDPYSSFNITAAERTPYLGIVTVALVFYAAIVRPRMSHRSFAWWCLALLVALSLGATWKIGRLSIPLPSSILWDLFPPYRATRVPSRFSLFAGVLAAVIAGAGFAHLMRRLPGAKSRAFAFAGLAALAIMDLTYHGATRGPIPPMPGCYDFIERHDPQAVLLEIPYDPTGTNLNSLCTYWQASHRLTTSAGYSGHDNTRLDAKIGQDSPFSIAKMARPDYLADPSRMPTEFGPDVNFSDFLWVYLTANHFDYIILHTRHHGLPDATPGLPRLKTALNGCKVFEDAESIVYARSRMKLPTHVVQMTRDGWSERNRWQMTRNCLLPDVGRLLVYNPSPDQELSISVDAAAVMRPRDVRVRSGGMEIARWRVAFGRFQTLLSPPFRLPRGLNEVTIEIDSRDDDQPFRLRVAGVAVGPANEVPGVASRGKPENGGVR
jgi:hypothetical protein